MKEAKRKSPSRAKRAKRVTRATVAKRPARYASAPPKPKATPDFDLLHAAHRARVGAAIASTAVEQLREVVQVVGLTYDASKRRGEISPNVAKAMSAAEEILAAQISELERYGVEDVPGPVNVADLLKRTAAIIRGSDRSKVTLTLDIGTKVPPAAANPLDLTEIVYALVINSYEALSKQGGRIHVSTAHDDAHVRIVVQDDGPGLTPAMRRNLFEPVARGRTAKSSLGIGLSVAQRLAERNGGELTYEPRAGRGARFVLLMPRWVSVRVRRGVARR